jgi:hypothetical protein
MHDINTSTQQKNVLNVPQSDFTYLASLISSSGCSENLIICNLLAVLSAAINVCLDMPNEKAVLYLADSNSASIKSDEHLRERRVATDTAVMRLATFSGKSVGDEGIKEVWYDDSCKAIVV